MRPFRSLVDTGQEYAVLGLVGDGTVDAWTEAAADLTGYDRGSVEGAHVSTLYADGEAPDGVPESDLLAAAEAGRIADERWLVREDGSSFRTRLVVTLVREASDGERSVWETSVGETFVSKQSGDERSGGETSVGRDAVPSADHCFGRGYVGPGCRRRTAH
jgi:PAS domain S-box-containing protein